MGMRAPIQAAADLTEKEFSRQIYDLCRTLSFERYHTWRSDKSPAGFPDEVLVRERVIFLEVKSAKGRLSEYQRHWIRSLLAAGAEVYVVRPADLQDLATVLAYRGDPRAPAPPGPHFAYHRLRDSAGKEAAA